MTEIEIIRDIASHITSYTSNPFKVAEETINRMKQLSYCSLAGKAPLLTDEQIRRVAFGSDVYWIGELGVTAADPPGEWMPRFCRVAKAQNDADNKFYGRK